MIPIPNPACEETSKMIRRSLLTTFVLLGAMAPCAFADWTVTQADESTVVFNTTTPIAFSASGPA